MLSVLVACAALRAPLPAQPHMCRTLPPQMAISFEEASKLWGLQRNRATGTVELVAEAFGYTTTDVTTIIERKSPGIGIALDELGSDGETGIVVVESCVEGGNAASASKPILAGDCIVAVSTVGSVTPTSVEALPYDATVTALGSLNPDSAVQLTLRRLVRVPRASVTLTFPTEQDRPDEKLDLLPGMQVRRSILSRGIKLNDPLAVRFDAGWGTGDCGGEGTCCTCALEIKAGAQALNPQSSQERQILKKHPTWRLACKASVGDLDEDVELVLGVAPRQLQADVVDDAFDSMAGERPE